MKAWQRERRGDHSSYLIDLEKNGDFEVSILKGKEKRSNT